MMGLHQPSLTPSLADSALLLHLQGHELALYPCLPLKLSTLLLLAECAASRLLFLSPVFSFFLPRFFCFSASTSEKTVCCTGVINMKFLLQSYIEDMGITHWPSRILLLRLPGALSSLQNQLCNIAQSAVSAPWSQEIGRVTTSCRNP